MFCGLWRKQGVGQPDINRLEDRKKNRPRELKSHVLRTMAEVGVAQPDI